MKPETKVESGLSVLSRLTIRPSLDHCLAPGIGPPSALVTRLELGECGVLEQYLAEVIARVTLPLITGAGVVVGGRGGGVVVLDCDHILQVGQVAGVLERKVRDVAESHYRELSRERRGERLTSGDQWEVVREALSRLWVVEVFTPDCLEVSLLSLQMVLEKNPAVSCVFVLGLNSFFHQVRVETGTSHESYVTKLLGLLETACRGLEEEVKVVTVEHKLFGDSVEEKSVNWIVIQEEGEESYSVRMGGAKVKFRLDNIGGIVWEEGG